MIRFYHRSTQQNRTMERADCGVKYYVSILSFVTRRASFTDDITMETRENVTTLRTRHVHLKPRNALEKRRSLFLRTFQIHLLP
mgnify:CR=1 FL=1